MPAKKGNTYAEKWTKETVLEALEEIKKHAKTQSCYYLGMALVRVDLYKQVWTYWKEKFAGEEEVLEPIKKIEQIFEAKLYGGILDGRYNATAGIFGLKNNHGWKDQSQVDHTSGGREIRNVNFNVVTQPNSNTTPTEDLEDG